MTSATAWIVLLYIASALALALAAHLWRRRSVPGAASCSLLMVASAFYSFGYAFELQSRTLASVRFWLSVEYLGIAFVPALWILVAIQYSRDDNRVHPVLRGLLFALSGLTLVSNLTNGSHHLFYRNLSLLERDGHFFLSIEQGPLYWVHMAYTNGVIVVATLLFIFQFRRSVRRQRQQVLYVLVGSLVPWAAILLYLFRVVRPYDPIPFSILVTGALFVLGILRDRLFQVNPLVLEKVVGAMQEAVVILDDRDRLLLHNRAAERILPGLSGLAKETANTSVRPLVAAHPELLALLDDPRGRAIAGTGDESVAAEVPRSSLTLRQETRLRHFEASLKPIGHRGLLLGRLLMLTDTTERQEFLATLNELANRDELTRLFNRRHFMERLDQEISRSRRHRMFLSIILFDLDHFKDVNDRYGHLVGDRMLQHVARTTRSCLRDHDILARFGGEEFIILLPQTDPSGARLVAERIRGRLAETPLDLENGQEAGVVTTASFGVCSLRPEEHSADALQLLHQVDEALYKAKAEGRNRVVPAAPSIS